MAIGVVALAILATSLDSALLRGLCLPAVLLALAAGTRTLRMALLCLAAVALIPLLLGYGETALALTPALIAALIAWIFARTLARDRRPLIARMIAAMDGVQMLAEPAIDRYARRLTALWAIYQGALALIGLRCSRRARLGFCPGVGHGCRMHVCSASSSCLLPWPRCCLSSSPCARGCCRKHRDARCRPFCAACCWRGRRRWRIDACAHCLAPGKPRCSARHASRQPETLVMSNMQHRESLHIGAQHPALPGHFPGAPVVPGVVLLDRVAAALQRWRGQRVAGLPQVKFLRPLLPDETAELVLSDDGKSIRFSIALGSTLIASGSIEAAP